MSRLDELLQTYCPNGVEYLEIHEVFELRNGYTPSTRNDSYWRNGSIPWFTMEDLRANGGTLNNSIQKITPDAVKGELFKANSVIISTSATIGEHALILVDFLANQRFTCLTRKKKYADLLNPKFVYYYCFNLSQWCKENINISGFASVDMGRFSKFKFPLPPLPVQEEIVRILDTFTALENELEKQLEAELAARTKQYEYYIHKLLFLSQKSIEPNVQSIKLGDIMHYSKESILANQLDKTCYVGVDNLLQNKKGKVDSEYVPKNGRLIKYKKDDILIGNIRPYLRKIWIADNEGGTNGDVLCIRVNKDAKAIAIPAYLYYVLSSEEFFTYAIKNSKGAKMPRGDKALTMKFEFPLPSLEVQKQIVSILDHFDALVNDLKSGLPAEIALRRKQYEYYRDKLLTFHPLK